MTTSTITASALELQQLPSINQTDRSDTPDPFSFGKSIVPVQKPTLRHRITDRLQSRSKARHFHQEQNQHIERLLSISRDPIPEEGDDSATRWHVKAAINLSIYGTIFVAGLQIYAAVTTLSLSLFVTMAESCCEAVSNIGLDILHRKSKKLSGSRNWPAGAERLGNAGNICFAFALMAVSLVLIVESIRALAAGGSEIVHFSVPAIIAASIGFSVKLFLAIYCYLFRNASSQLEMLWEDNRNDCFEYGFAIFTSAAGAKLAWWVDPAGAMLIASVIIVTWIITVKHEMLQLCGKGAPPAFIREVTFAAIRHSDAFLQIDSVSAYHWGEKYIVEVDVIMAPENGLTLAHDLSQSLQDKLERFEDVARAYVHVDYGQSTSLALAVPFTDIVCPLTDSVHAPEHRKNR